MCFDEFAGLAAHLFRHHQQAQFDFMLEVSIIANVKGARNNVAGFITRRIVDAQKYSTDQLAGNWHANGSRERTIRPANRTHRGLTGVLETTSLQLQRTSYIFVCFPQNKRCSSDGGDVRRERMTTITHLCTHADNAHQQPDEMK